SYLSLEAIRQLAHASFTTPLPITVLFTPDEEVGTPSTRDIIEAEAARNKYVLVPEPGRANNGVVTGRYAIARFNLEAIGKPSHAGAALSAGRSAIREMARQIIAIDAMTSEDCTCPPRAPGAARMPTSLARWEFQRSMALGRAVPIRTRSMNTS